MIKCISFSKLLKLSFSILLIGFLGLFVNFSSAYDWFFWQKNTVINRIELWLVASWNWISIGSFSDDNFNFINDDWKFFQYVVPSNWNVLSYWWQFDWLHYSSRYNSSTSLENWIINWFYLCSDTYNGPWNSYNTLNTRDNCTFNTWFNNLLEYTVWSDWWFYACNNWTPNNPNSTFTNCLVCLHNNWYVCIDKSNVSNVKNEYLTTVSVKSIASFNPYSRYYWDMQGPVEIQPWNNLTWDYLYQNVSYWEIWDYVENKLWYSKYLCYWWIDNFDISSGGISPIPWTWKNIDEIQLNWQNVYNWTDFFAYRKWLYWQNYLWDTVPYVYKTWFDFYYQYWWANYEFNDVYSYCKTKYILQLNRDTIYNWNNYKGIIDKIIREKRFWLSLSWDIVWVNRNWIWNNTWTWTDKNAVVYIQNFFNLLKENFPTKYDLWLWLLPAYIITFMLALILFRFISH